MRAASFRKYFKPGALAGAFLLASLASPVLAADNVPAAPAQSAQQLQTARAKIREHAEYAMRSTDYFSGVYEHYQSIQNIVKVNPALANEAIEQIGRAFSHRSPDKWHYAIDAIQNIAAGDVERSRKAYEVFTPALVLASSLINSGNTSLQGMGVTAATAIAERMPGFHEAVAEDMLTILSVSERAYNWDAMENALRFLGSVGSKNEAIARQIEASLKAHLLSAQSQYKAVIREGRNTDSNRGDLRQQLEQAAGTYSLVTSAHQSLARGSFDIFVTMLQEPLNFPANYSNAYGENPYRKSAVYALGRIGESRAELSRDVLNMLDVYAWSDEKNLDYYGVIGAMSAIAKAQPEQAPNAAGKLKEMALSAKFDKEMRRIIDAINSIDSSHALKTTEGLCEQLGRGGLAAGKTVEAFQSLGVTNEICAQQALAAFKTFADSRAHTVVNQVAQRDVAYNIGSIGKKYPAQKQSAVDLLNTIALKALNSGNSELLTTVSDQLSALRKKPAP